MNIKRFFDTFFEEEDYTNIVSFNDSGKVVFDQTILASGIDFKKLHAEKLFHCFTPNTIFKNKTRSNANVEKLNCLYIDIDDSKENPLSILEKANIPKPHFIFSRDKKHFHLYWLIEQVYANPSNKNQFVKLEENLIKLLSADKAVKDVSRLMRIPFLDYYKNKMRFWYISFF